jgi:hypothetical protein
VSARLGELLPVTPERLAAANLNAKQKPRKKRKPLFESDVGIRGPKNYKVHFDDGSERECCSKNLKSHRQGAYLPPEDALQISKGGFDGGESFPASIKAMEAISDSSAADADTSDDLGENEHLPHDDEIIQDLLGIVDGDGGLESSEKESSDNQSTFERPISPVDFGINPFHDYEPMPSLDAVVVMSSAAVAATATPNVGGAAATATPNVTAAAITLNVAGKATTVTPNVLALLSQGCPLDRFNSVKSKIVTWQSQISATSSSVLLLVLVLRSRLDTR